MADRSKKRTISEEVLRERQSWDLDTKIKWAEARLIEWWEHWKGKVYVSFSGGMDSTVLLHLVREVLPDVPAIFVDTGLEFPEIREHVKRTANVTWLRPKMTFGQVIEKYGYPVPTKRQAQYIHEVRHSRGETATKHLRLTGIRRDGSFHSRDKISNKWQYLIDAPFKISSRCCHFLKKKPFGEAEQRFGAAINGVRVVEGGPRERAYVMNGCNGFNAKHPISTPLAIWHDDQIWEYVHRYDVPYSKVYDMGYVRTGCMFCLFGCHMEKEPNRIQRLAETHPKRYRYILDKLGFREVMDYCGIPYERVTTRQTEMFDDEGEKS